MNSTTRRARLNVRLCAALVAAVIASACRSEPADPYELLNAHSLGVGFLQRGQLSEAERQFQKVVSLAPRDPLGHANLGLTYMRGGRYSEAEDQLRRARRLDASNAEIALMLARLYSESGRTADARRILEEFPNDARALYALAELEAERADGGDAAALRRYEEYLRRALAAAPANLALRLKLTDVMLRRGLADSALAHLEDIRRLRPEPAREARPHLDSTLQQLRAGSVAGARAAFQRFVHAMELTAPYQAALEQVRWVQGTLVGRPVLAFKPQTLITTRGLLPVGRRVDVRFTDVSGEAGLADGTGAPTALAIGDFDGNESDNLLVASAARTSGETPQRERSSVNLYSVQGMYLMDVTDRMAVPLPAGANYATFADFDNDGWLDLYAIGTDGRGYLLRNVDGRRLEDVTARAGIANASAARKALFIDIDHDGDLDLLLVGSRGPGVGGGSAAIGSAKLWRNNGDGTFSDITDAFGLRASVASYDAAFADFTGDGRIDVFVAGANGADKLYLNTGLQRLSDHTAASGIASERQSAAVVAVGDYDNDGAFDILVAEVGSGRAGESGASVALWRNSAAGDGTFTRDRRSDAAFERLARMGTVSVEFFDYDNDGWLDLVALGRGGMFLFHNDGTGRFEDRSALLPADLRSAPAAETGASLIVNDVDGDGDQDLIVATSTGVRLLRNDGGNANLAMQMQLVGLRTGSGKNNTFGIGSRVEVRAGEIYQTRVVTRRITHFGLGPHLKADVVRIEWTNGVPETIYFPGTDQDVVELEMLKGSCAFVYTWDGKQFRFVTDVMWRSALGMPVGIMGGGRAAYAPAGASKEYIRIPGEALQSRNGRYVLKVTEELWETAYLDEIKLLVVDHPDSADVFVDERFPPAQEGLRMFQVVRRTPPLSAVDGNGRNVLEAVRDKDDVYASALAPLQYQGLVEAHELILDLEPEAGRAGSYLFLRGWIYPTDASINVALSQNPKLAAVMPSLEVRNARGQWETAIPSIGFPSGKDKTIVVDLSNIFPTADRRVRIRTSMQIYWDQVFIAYDQAEQSAARTTVLQPLSGELQYRGFSRMYRKGGRSGPHWFDYDSVSTTSPWRTIEGAFTRFGDVLPLLQRSDDMYVIMAPGDEVTVEFDARAAGEPPAGWKRTFLLYTDGWIKDADLNTAFGNTVEPLPFQAIREYPYAAGESYPTDSVRQRYLREYNTRIVRQR